MICARRAARRRWLLPASGAGALATASLIVVPLASTSFPGEPTAQSLTAEELRADAHKVFAPRSLSLTSIIADGDGYDPSRRRICAATNARYTGLFSGTARGIPREELTAQADEILSGTWRAGGDSIRVTTPIDWNNQNVTRSIKFWLHSWKFLNPLLRADFERLDAVQPRTTPYLSFAIDVALDWSRGRFFQFDDYRTASRQAFAWYDMAAGHRAALLGYLVARASCSPDVSEDTLLVLLRMAVDHLLYLAADEYHVFHNNHGIFQSAGTLALCDNVPVIRWCGPARAIAESRLLDAFDRQFSSDGFHLEHSSGYHLAILDTIGVILRGEYLSPLAAQTVRELLRKAQVALSWYVKPDRSLVRFGDTDRRVITTAIVTGLLDGLPREDSLLWVASAGASGAPPPTQAFASREAGLAFFRQSPEHAPFARLGYLALSAAFHSRTHKQADDMTFEWSHGGQDLVIDAGRYGYLGKTEPGSDLWEQGFWYSDPNRVYVESTHAHNTVEIDGTSDPRRYVRPYGSGVLRAEMVSASAFVAEAAVPRPSGIEHRRALLLRPGEWLLVIDVLSADGDEPSGRPGEQFEQWFHLAPAARLAQQQPEQLAFILGDTTLVVRPLFAVKERRAVLGQREPRLQGWYSRRGRHLAENYAVGFQVAGLPARYATLLDISGKAVTRHEAAAGAPGEPTRLRWQYADGSEVAITYEVGGDGIAIALE